MAQLVTYSGAAVNVTLAGPLIGAIQFGGIAQTGLAALTVRMTVDHANIQYGMDGAAVPTWTPGEGGEIDVEVWQNSTTQQLFVAAYDIILANALTGIVLGTFANTMLIADLSSGSLHTCSGVAFPKVPDKTYQEQSQRVHWVFKACNINTE